MERPWMPTVKSMALAGLIWAALLAPVSAQETPTCQDLANEIVKSATTGVLKDAVEAKPELKQLSDEELVLKAGRIFLAAERPDFKAYGYMMLLWFGGKTGRELVVNIAPKLNTEADRAHYYFVLGLYQLRSSEPEVAAKGRDYVRQMRDSGKVEFVEDGTWDDLITGCRLPS